MPRARRHLFLVRPMTLSAIERRRPEAHAPGRAHLAFADEHVGDEVGVAPYQIDGGRMESDETSVRRECDPVSVPIALCAADPRLTRSVTPSWRSRTNTPYVSLVLFATKLVAFDWKVTKRPVHRGCGAVAEPIVLKAARLNAQLLDNAMGRYRDGGAERESAANPNARTPPIRRVMIISPATSD